MRIRRFISLLLLAVIVLMSSEYMTANVKAATKWDKSKVNVEIERLDKKYADLKKLYNAEEKKVKEKNSGAFYLYTDDYYYSYGYYYNNLLYLKDYGSGMVYIIISGTDNISIWPRGGGSYYVSGYVRKNNTISAPNGYEYLTGVRLAENKYENKLEKVRKKLNKLENALDFSYRIVDGYEFKVGKEYNISRRLKKSDNYNTPEWEAFDNEVATLTEDGTFVFKQEGFVEVTVKASVSEKTTTEWMSTDYFGFNYTIIDGKCESESYEYDNGKYRLKAACNSKFKVNLYYWDEKNLSYESSDDSLFTVSNDGLVEILSSGFGIKNGKITEDYYITVSYGPSKLKIYIGAT